ncbi:G-protein coupled receptor GRL101-like [Amphiura filiformis]|uniref:G-protein coupled receptor GRL101-like n=1 Tax=Amphiura filiformis TaxID=82378 RepID=UPI003B21FC9F
MNKLLRLKSGIFGDFVDLEHLNISKNSLMKLTNGDFDGLLKLSMLDAGLSSCHVASRVWLIGLNALGGNIFVLVWRNKGTPLSKVNTMLLINLAISDFMMGVYMLIIASADIYFGGYFPMQSESWRYSTTCRFAGALSIISSEASVFFVTLISIDRFICIRFPYSTRKITRHSVRILVILIWIVSFALGTVPSVLSGKNVKFYDNSHVCIGLPLALTKRYITEYQSVFKYNSIIAGIEQEIATSTFDSLVDGLYFSTALFLGLNCICYLVILGCYIEIVRAVRQSPKRAGPASDRKEQIRLTMKVSAIVGTDFCCWFPIILLGILVQTRVITLPPSVYAWSVTFILPINSAINPYIYTIVELISKYRKNRQRTMHAIAINLQPSSSNNQPGDDKSNFRTRTVTLSAAENQNMIIAPV